MRQLDHFHAVGSNVFHATSQPRPPGIFPANWQTVYARTQLHIHQPGEGEETYFCPAQAITLSMTPAQCQGLAAYFSRLARVLLEIDDDSPR